MYILEKIKDHNAVIIPDRLAKLYMSTFRERIINELHEDPKDGIFFSDLSNNMWGLIPMGRGSIDNIPPAYDQDLAA